MAASPEPGSTGVRVGDRSNETEIYIPTTVHGQVNVEGAALLDAIATQRDGSRLVYVAPGNRAGTCGPSNPKVICNGYVVTVGSVTQGAWSASLDAKQQLLPLSEPQARTALESELSQALISPDPSVRAKAGEAEIAAQILLGPNDPNSN